MSACGAFLYLVSWPSYWCLSCLNVGICC